MQCHRPQSETVHKKRVSRVSSVQAASARKSFYASVLRGMQAEGLNVRGATRQILLSQPKLGILCSGS